MPSVQEVRDHLRSSLWFIPALFAAGASVLAMVLVEVDHGVGADPNSLFFEFGGSAEGARSVLSTIALSTLTFTGLVFTITMLVLQLASSQLSPRVMRTFLRDRANQVVLGLFVATFVFTLLILREVRTPADPDPGFVPTISSWVAFALLLASVAAFIYYIDHMAHAIRASTVITSIWQETVEAIERLYPELVGIGSAETELPEELDGPPMLEVGAPRAGVVLAIDMERLLAAAGKGDRVAAVIPAVGMFVAENEPLVRLWGQWDDAAADEVRDAVGIGKERSMEQDAAFGIRQLVDVATRALSPGTNDPTTAVLALDRIHDILRRLAVRHFPSPSHADGGGTFRLLLKRPGWDEMVHSGLDEIRLASTTQLQVVERIDAVLADLLTVTGEDRKPVLRQARARLRARASADVQESARFGGSPRDA